MADNDAPPDLVRTLNERNFFALLGTYLAVGFGLLQFIEFLVNRYGLDADYIDRYLVLWLVSVPAVSLLIYFRGHLPRRPRGLSWQQWAVAANLLLSLTLAVLLFRGGDRTGGSAVQEATVTATDESGAKITAVIPGQRQVKYISVFPFDNASGRDSLEWWSLAIGNLVAQDLRQQPDYYPQPAYSLIGYYNNHGLPPFAHLSVATQRSIADEVRTAYFVKGEYAWEGREFTVTGAVMRTSDSKAMVQLSASGTDPLDVLDRIGDQIVQGLPRPSADVLEGRSELPVASLVTENLTALRQHTEAKKAFLLNPGDVAGALELHRRAMASDPRCALCVFEVADKLYGLGRQDSSQLLLERASRLASTLPRRDQIDIRAIMYVVRSDYDAYYQLMELSRKLYPYDYGAYGALLTRYKNTYGLDSAMALMQEAVRNGHAERGLLNLYNLELEAKRYERAEATLDRFFREFPERSDDRLRYVTLYELQNKPERAAQALQELITLDPFNMSFQFAQADMELRSGKMANGPSTYERLLRDAENRQDSVRAYTSLASVLTALGDVDESERYLAELEEFLRDILPPNRIVSQTFRAREYNYLYTGDQGKLDSLIGVIGRYGQDMDRMYGCAARADAVQLLAAGELAGTSLRDCRETLLRAQYPEAVVDVLDAYLAGDFAAAADLLDGGDDDAEASAVLTEVFQARVYRLAGRAERAETVLREHLDVYKDEPNTLVELYLTTGDEAFLTTALDVWSGADGDFIPARDARDLLAQRK